MPEGQNMMLSGSALHGLHTNKVGQLCAFLRTVQQNLAVFALCF